MKYSLKHFPEGNDNTIPMQDMQIGDIGKIDVGYTGAGAIVLCVPYEVIVSLDDPSRAWLVDKTFKSDTRVRLLHKGESVTLTVE